MSSPTALFFSWHFYLDSSNGASVSARELLLALTQRAWTVKTFCGPAVDNPNLSSVDQILADYAIKARQLGDENNGNSKPFRLSTFSDKLIRSVVYSPNDPAYVPSPQTGEYFLAFFKRALEDLKPDVVITYGGYWMAQRALDLICDARIKSVFLLQNFDYHDKKLFKNVDLTLVLSEYMSKVYRDRLGIETTAIPPLRNMNALVGAGRDLPPIKGMEGIEKYILFVNPLQKKGVYFISKIATELARIRPEIPLVVVESCANARAIATTRPPELSGVRNIFVMTLSRAPERYLRHARMTLVPSVFAEPFSRVSAESMLAGVPVVCSDRGALPETVGDAGRVIPIPSNYTPVVKTLPTSEEVAPWLDEILRLWDDDEYHALRSRLAMEHARRWDYESLANHYDAALRGLLNHPH